jgi:hypothetical protein
LGYINKQQAAIIVVDNASTDDSKEIICRWAHENIMGYKQLKNVNGPSSHTLTPNIKSSAWNFLFVKSELNLGYAGGNNIGINIALECAQFEYIWILNNDTVVEHTALEFLVKAAKQQADASIIGSTIIEYYNKDLIQYAGGSIYHPISTITKGLLSNKLVKSTLNKSLHLKPSYISGAAMFCKADTLCASGVLNEFFFLYYEEIDLANRIRALGKEILWCKESFVYHKGGSSTKGKSMINNSESWDSNYHENLSTLIYTQIHHKNILWIAALLRLTGKSIAYLKPGRLHLYSTLYYAYRDFLHQRKTHSTPIKKSTKLLGINTLNLSDK